ncbi:MAG: proteasome-activating nucleotidase [Thermoplasmata archaeon]|nr:MAG: proteasome-activating nucleotidase [Thermoplasmata archaeon]
MSMDDDLEARLSELEEKNNELLEEVRRAEIEKEYMESELLRLQREIKNLRMELEKLKRPPLIVGYVKDILSNGNVVIKSTTGPEFIVTAAEYVRNLTPGARVALNKQTFSIVGVLPPIYDPIVMGAEIIERPDVTYDDIGGLEEQIKDVREIVELPLLKPHLYRKVGIDPPKGVMFIGPPGTGKTLLAKAVARHTKATFIRIVGSELVQKYIGEGARLVRELFDLARKKAPSIVFIDEIDAIGAKRLEMATSGDREVQRTLMQLLAELDGFEPLSDVRIIAATNRPDILDPALLRPGRFDRIIEFPIPNYEARVKIFQIHTRRMNLSKRVDLKAIAAKCDGATGADIKTICTEAGMFAIRDERTVVEPEDFERAIEKVMNEIRSTPSQPEAMFA